MEKNVAKAVAAGLLGTFVMTIVMFMAPLISMPPMPIGKMLAGFMGIPEGLGWMAHFMIGTILAFVYIYFFVSRLKGSGFTRGAIYGLFLWFVAQVMVNPIMGAGVFALYTLTPFLMVTGSLIGHLVYGAVLGGIYGTGKELKPAAQSNG